jgi:hypothetical protein
MKHKNEDLRVWKSLVQKLNESATMSETHDNVDHEVSMAKSQLLSAVKSATRIGKNLANISEEKGIDGWIASKITMAQDYLQAVADYLDGEAAQGIIPSDEKSPVEEGFSTENINEIFGFGKKAQMRRGAMNLANDIMIKQIIMPALQEFKGAFESVNVKEDKGDFALSGYSFIVFLNVSDDYQKPMSRDGQTTYFLANDLAHNVQNAIRASYKQWKSSAEKVHGQIITHPDILTTFGANFKHSDGNYEQNLEIRFRILNGDINSKFTEEETYEGDEFYEAYGDLWFNEDDQLDEAEYQGRKVKLGKPMRSKDGPKKFHVFVKDQQTKNVKKVNFGDPDMKIKKSNPARRKSFRARHNCDNPGPRTKARYWSCRKW